MIRLPRGKSVKSGIDLSEVDISTALRTLQQGRFTGYLAFDLEQGAAVLIFLQGKLAEAVYEDDRSRLTAGLGLNKTAQVVRKQGGRLHIYRIEEDLAKRLTMVLGGSFLLEGESLKNLNIKAVLARMAKENRTGCLRIYSDDRVAMVFYDQGRPVGFFHEDSAGMTTEADLSMSVARDANACLDVLVPSDTIYSEVTDLLSNSFD